MMHSQVDAPLLMQLPLPLHQNVYVVAFAEGIIFGDAAMYPCAMPLHLLVYSTGSTTTQPQTHATTLCDAANAVPQACTLL